MIKLPSGHPRLQPENQQLLPTAPHLRQAQLDRDAEQVAMMKEERMGGVPHLEYLRVQMEQARQDSAWASQANAF